MSIVEIARFRLKAGASDQAMIEAEKLLKAGIINQQPGFQGRELTRSENGEWVLLMHWASVADAEAWGPKLMQDPNAPAFVSLLDTSSLRKEYCTVV